MPAEIPPESTQSIGAFLTHEASDTRTPDLNDSSPGRSQAHRSRPSAPIQRSADFHQPQQNQSHRRFSRRRQSRPEQRRRALVDRVQGSIESSNPHRAEARLAARQRKESLSAASNMTIGAPVSGRPWIDGSLAVWSGALLGVGAFFLLGTL